MGATPAWKILTLDTVDSTQLELERRIAAGASARTVVVAANQTAGRGRQGRVWLSPSGGLWFSLVIDRCTPPEPILGLLMATSCVAATRSELATDGAERLRIKWPNDLIIDDRKWGGVLTDCRPLANSGTRYVCGVGLNLQSAPRDLPPTALPATSLRTEFGQSPSPDRLLSRILARFDEILAVDDQRGRAHTIEQIVPLVATIGRSVSWSESRPTEPKAAERQGLAVGLGLDGALEIEHPNASRTAIRVSEVQHVRTN
ncbi:MAG: biotin--[acetyl-CoA-carboxylase] ligase [Planctomycetota bacterium]